MPVTLWQKGVSGNPSGRPKKQINVVTLAKQHTERAVMTLVAALDSPRERVPAAIALLDRGWGKPAQTLQTTDSSGVSLHLIAAQVISAQLLEQRTEPPAIDQHTIDGDPLDQPTE